MTTQATLPGDGETQPTALTRTALALRRRGLAVFPVPMPHPGTPKGRAGDGKVPRIAWKKYQQALPTEEEVRAWFASGGDNIAVICGGVSGLVVVDADNAEAEAWAHEHLPETPWRVRTAKGVHLYFRHPGEKVRNRARIRTPDGRIALDIRADGGFVVGPGSFNGLLGGETVVADRARFVRYRLEGDWSVGRTDLPVFDLKWIEEPPRAAATPAPAAKQQRPPASAIDPVERARRWLAKRDPAVENEGGDTHTFATAATLVRGFGLSVDDTIDLLLDWNRTCVPPWTREDLERKVRNALEHGTEAIGGMLDARPGNATALTPVSGPATAPPRSAPDADAWEAGPDKAGDVAAPRQATPHRAETAPEDVPFVSGDILADVVLPTREVLATTSTGKPLFRRRMLVHIGAKPGVGKTLGLIGLSVAASLADTCFGIVWSKPLNVLFLDLELPTTEFQARYRAELRGRTGSSTFRLVSSDAMERPLGALYAPEEMARMMPLYEWADLVIIDSASYGLPTEEDNSATAWKVCEDFLLFLRRMDKLVLTTFHLNATGSRIRGSSAKEQSADLVALLNRPPGSEDSGAHFTWTWTKRRGVTADVAQDFEVALKPDGWSVSTVDEASKRQALLHHLRAAMPVNDAAEDLGIPRSTAYRWRSELIETGLLGKPPGWEKRQGRGQ